MLTPSEKITRGGVTQFHAISVFTSRNLVVFSNQVAELCQEVSLLLMFGEADRLPGCRVWACLDQRGSAPGGPAGLVTSSVHLLAEWTSPKGAMRLAVDGLCNVAKSGTGQLLEHGREKFQEWLLRQFLARWRDTAQKPFGEPHNTLASCVRAWVYGSPNHLYGLDENGTVVALDETLPNPESYYTDARRGL